MAKTINLKPIQAEHLKTLSSYLDSIGINSMAEEVDFVQNTENPPENCRQKCIRLEGTHIDKLLYAIMQNLGTSRRGQSSMTTENNWSAFYLYVVECYVGKDKENWKNLNAKVKVKYKKGDIVDFKWSGGKIADVLNHDTSLKEPLLTDLANTLRAGGEAEIALWPKLALADSDIKMLAKIVSVEGADANPESALRSYEPVKEGVLVLGCATRGYGDEIRPLILPSKDGFMAYDRVAKHIRDYANTTIAGSF
ncbi:MAG: hypothetical protein KAT53_06505 [Dehalococcoidia bacterium]|nr:hypothetical protein [Dehalococcoidia bacterium]